MAAKDFNRIDWDAVALGAGYKIIERKPQQIRMMIPGPEAEGGGELLISDNGGEVNLTRVIYKPLEIPGLGPGSIPYTSCRRGDVGPLTMASRIGLTVASERGEDCSIDWDLDLDRE